MYCAVLTVNDELVDYKIGEDRKELADFNKSLVAAGYPFWQEAKVINFAIANTSQAVRWLTSYKMAEKRCFNSITEGFSVKNIHYCNCCGYTLRTEFHFCPICGEEID